MKAVAFVVVIGCVAIACVVMWAAMRTTDTPVKLPYRFDFSRGGKAAVAHHFSVQLPEGNYRVTLGLGDADTPSQTTVKAETRQLMLEDISTVKGEIVTRSFVVNIRTPPLKLEFLGATAKVATLSIEAADVPTIYLLGDSTVADQSNAPSASWGQMLPRFFGPGIAVANHAANGETLKSFLTSLRLDKVLSSVRAGDWLMIQFGHNDQKTQRPQTYVEAGTTYRAYLSTYIAEARRRGATPILITSPERRTFDSAGRIVNSLGDYPDAMRAVARELGVALIDLNSMSTVFYEALGPERAALAFADEGRDQTHHNNYGAYELARMIVTGIRQTEPKLAAFLATDSGEFDPAHPDPPKHFPD